MASSLLPKPPSEWPDSDIVESYGDIAVERWQRTDSWREGRRKHSPTNCPCFACADGRELLGLTPFKPSRLAHANGVGL
jgi:hypothetical protein